METIYGGLWMKLKWGGIFRILNLDKSNKGMEIRRRRSKETTGMVSWPYKISHGIDEDRKKSRVAIIDEQGMGLILLAQVLCAYMLYM